jgi:hypothetical protein
MAPGRSQVKRRNPAFFRGICAIVPRVWSIGFGFALALFWSSSAAAFEDKLALGVGPGYALSPSSEAAHGVALDAHAGIGLSETWQLRAGATFAGHPHPSEELYTAALRAEILYLIDIVDIVPFGGVGVAGMAWFGAEPLAIEPAAHLTVGAAYWLSFDWLLQLDVRGHVLPLADSSDQRDWLYLVSTLSVVLTLDR